MPEDATPPKAEGPSSKTIFYHLGLAVYVAQQLEAGLGQLIVCAERLGLLTVDRKALGIESVLDRCLGPNLKYLKSQV